MYRILGTVVGGGDVKVWFSIEHAHSKIEMSRYNKKSVAMGYTLYTHRVQT